MHNETLVPPILKFIIKSLSPVVGQEDTFIHAAIENGYEFFKLGKLIAPSVGFCQHGSPDEFTNANVGSPP